MHLLVHLFKDFFITIYYLKFLTLIENLKYFSFVELEFMAGVLEDTNQGMPMQGDLVHLYNTPILPHRIYWI